MAAIMLCSGALALCGREKQLLPINVKNGFEIRLGTYKCQSGLVGDQKTNKITSYSKRQKLSRKLSQAVAVCSRCNMSVPIGGRAGQLLCGGGITASPIWLLRVLR
jgi:hypothetical protein